MRQTSTRDQVAYKLTANGYQMAFKNEQIPYRIVSYKRAKSQMWNNLNENINDLINKKKEHKNKNVTQQ